MGDEKCLITSEGLGCDAACIFYKGNVIFPIPSTCRHVFHRNLTFPVLKALFFLSKLFIFHNVIDCVTVFSHAFKNETPLMKIFCQNRCPNHFFSYFCPRINQNQHYHEKNHLHFHLMPHAGMHSHDLLRR